MIVETSLNLPTIITLILSAVGLVTWLVRLESRVGSNSKEMDDLAKRADAANALAILTQNMLSEYKTHVAEHYVTKQGMSEQTDRLMKAVNDVASRIDAIGSRIDHFYANPPTRPTRRTGQ